MSASGAHQRCASLWGSASKHPCVRCAKQAQEWAYDGTDPEERYERLTNSPSNKRERWQLFSTSPEFYMPLCLSCHRSLDRQSAYAELHQYRLWKSMTGLSITDLEVSA